MLSPSFRKLPFLWRRRWWFLDPESTTLATDSAFRWEMVRRSHAYAQIWKEIEPLPMAGQLQQAAQLGGPFDPGVMHWLGRAQRSPLIRLAFWNRCSPFDR